jgi:hypothetical protein
MANEEHDPVHPDERVVGPDERRDQEAGLLRDGRLVDEGACAECKAVGEDDVERLVGEVDAVPDPPVRDPDDGERGCEDEDLRRIERREDAVQPAAPTRVGAP